MHYPFQYTNVMIAAQLNFIPGNNEWHQPQNKNDITQYMLLVRMMLLQNTNTGLQKLCYRIYYKDMMLSLIHYSPEMVKV